MPLLQVLISGVLILMSASLTHFYDERRVKVEASERRAESVRDLKLSTFSKMSREVEIASGRLYKLAISADINERDSSAELLHDAWYATRDFDVLFPRYVSKTDEIRRLLLMKRDATQRQLDVGQYNFVEIKESDVRVILDEISAEIRSELGIHE